MTGDAAATVLGEPFSISSSSEEDRMRFLLRPLFEADLTGDDSSSLETFSFSEVGLKRFVIYKYTHSSIPKLYISCYIEIHRAPPNITPMGFRNRS